MCWFPVPAKYRFFLALAGCCLSNAGLSASELHAVAVASDAGIVSLMQHSTNVDVGQRRRFESAMKIAPATAKPRLDICGNPATQRASFAAARVETRAAAASESGGFAEAMRVKTQRILSVFMMPGPLLPDHPFPSLDWNEVKLKPTIICCLVLFLGAVLCSAGGIGGGGVYVTVLMVAGQLSPHDAVPLSKAVVFSGSLASLVLNLRKALTLQQDDSKPQKTFIDYNICRLVVPCSLLGTLLGVMINSMIAPWLIVVMLIGILSGMSYMSAQKFLSQYMEENRQLDNPQDSPNPQENPQDDAPNTPAAAMEEESKKGRIRGILCNGEGFGAFFLLIFVIACGVFRQHAGNCRDDIQKGTLDLLGNNSCARPVMNTIFGGALCTWMNTPVINEMLPLLSMAVPAATCAIITWSYGVYLVKHEDWQPKQVVGYCTMAVLTGCFAGLVGIGGGLVFSPFMLWMGVDSAIAVATSSTCVIFTSSSTTIQYLLTDRIILSLTIIYGLCSTAASLVGTSLAHLLQEKYRARPSYITGVVCLGVFASVILSVYKLFTIGVGKH